MSKNSEHNLVQRSKALSAGLGVSVFLLGILVLAGWALDVPLLKGGIPTIGTTMKANTALGFALSGASLWLVKENRGSGSRRWALALGIGLIFGAGLTLLESILKINRGIAQSLFVGPAGVGVPSPGRMSLITALAFLCSGLSLVLMDVKTLPGRLPSQLFACLAGAVGFVTIAGYAYRAEFLFGPQNYPQIAFHTAGAFLVLSVGLLLARPETGIMEVATSDSPSGRIFRRMAPAVLLVPLCLGWLRLEGESDKLFHARTGLTFLVFSTASLLFALVWASAGRIHIMETQSRGARKALASAEEKARILFEMAGSGMGVVDFEGRIREVNRRWEKIFGMDRGEILGKTVFEFLSTKDRPFLETRFRRLAVGEQIQATEWELLRPDGDSVIVESYPAKVEIDGTPFMVVALNDVTDRARARKQANLNDKLATVGTLAAGVVHEINNPTASAILNLEILAELFGQFPEDPSRKDLVRWTNHLAHALEALFRIKEIVSSIKGFARMDAEDLFPVDINAILDSSIVMTAHETKFKTQVIREYADDLPAVPANRGRLQQLFVNLIVNAAQAMDTAPTRNRIIIRTRSEEDHVRVDFEDTGGGIPKEVQPKIFDPFFTTKPEGVGTGLGLPICHEIVRQHGGEFSVESEVGRGTRFSLTLSLFAGAAHVSERRALDTALPRLLLVDDDPLVLAALRRNLIRSFHVLVAQGGRAAIELLGREPVDAIATDLNMPEVSGLDLYRHIAKAVPSMERRLVFFSGADPTPQFREFLESSRKVCLAKPFSAPELKKAIEDAVAQG